MSEINNKLKMNEKEITIPTNQIYLQSIVSDGFFYQAENHIVGVTKTNIDNTISFTAPKSTGNAFYERMLTAETVGYNSFLQTGIGEGLESWYKILTNVKSAHLNGGEGIYNIFLYSGREPSPNMYIYDFEGNLVASDETGSQKASFSLDFGKTYYLRVVGFEYSSLTLGVSYDNVGGAFGTYTSTMENNSLYLISDMPNISKNYRFKKAKLTLYQKPSSSATEQNCKLGIYPFASGVYPGCSISECGDLCDYVKIKQPNGEEVIAYTFDIMDAFEKCIEDGDSYLQLLVKPAGNNLQQESYTTIYGTSSEYPPKLTITYEANYGVNTDYRYDSHELGRFGQGSIDLQYGNLMFESEDFAWGGNRMPVTIKHLYNSLLYNQQYTVNSSIGLNVADFEAMKLGLGFKLNIMQSMVTDGDGNYIYTGENGEEIYFKQTNDDIYKTSEEDGELEYNAETHILDNGDKYLFDGNGRLIKITDENNNTMEIVYTDNKITSVKDAVNREFSFLYDDNNFLTSITAPDGSQITYAYNNNLLTAVNYPNGKSVQITYTDKKPATITLYDNNTPVQKMQYTFNNYSVREIIEYGYKNGVAQQGDRKEYTYSISAGTTNVYSSENHTNTVCVFDNDGQIVSEYLVPNIFSGINNLPLENGEGVTAISNLLTGHNFEEVATDWSGYLSASLIEAENEIKYGRKYLRITSNGGESNGIYQNRYIPEGSCTLSAYMRVKSGFSGENDGAYLSIYDANAPDAILNSEKLRIPSDEFVRVSVTFDDCGGLYCGAAIMVDGAGVVEVYAPQFEYNAAPNSYNHISDSSFDNEGSWTLNNAGYAFEGGFTSYRSLKIT
ncbi:MAG: hypothetical protein IJD45_06225, partial [Clostridia bacterium]|nr:hypothetical protein [Clostridia bacterium]